MYSSYIGGSQPVNAGGATPPQRHNQAHSCEVMGEKKFTREMEELRDCAYQGSVLGQGGRQVCGGESVGCIHDGSR